MWQKINKEQSNPLLSKNSFKIIGSIKIAETLK